MAGPAQIALTPVVEAVLVEVIHDLARRKGLKIPKVVVRLAVQALVARVRTINVARLRKILEQLSMPIDPVPAYAAMLERLGEAPPRRARRPVKKTTKKAKK